MRVIGGAGRVGLAVDRAVTLFNIDLLSYG